MSATGAVGGAWLAEEREAAATDRILDAAGELFAARGVTAVGMAEIAAAAGCSRATLYRYFENRQQLRESFVHREARRLAAAVAEQVASVADPAERLVGAVLAALDGVRSTPSLRAWFGGEDAGATADLAGSSRVIEAFTAAFLDPASDDDTRERARWIVRIVVSLLITPAASRAEERHLLQRYLAPVVI